MRIFFILLLISISLSSSAQYFSPKQNERLIKLDIDLKLYDLDNDKNVLSFIDILNYDRKMRVNRNIGISITSLAALSFMTGAVFYDWRGQAKEGKSGLANAVAMVFWVNSILVATVSIPFWGVAYIRKYQRDKRIATIRF